MRLWLVFLSVIALQAGNANAYAQAGNTVKAAPTGVFSSYEVKSGGIDSFPNWTRVLARIQTEEATYAACDKSVDKCQTPQLRAWRAFLHQTRKDKTLSELEVIKAVNAFANRWPYRSDMQIWGKSDYWASPLEFIAKNGDCEDFAILKYVSLKALGYGDDRLRLVVVRDVIRQIGHAVLAVYPKVQGGTVYVLDSLVTDVLPDTGFLQYDPYYSINATTRWIHIPAKKHSTLLKK